MISNKMIVCLKSGIPLVARSIPRHAFILYATQGCAFLHEVDVIITVGVCRIFGSGKLPG